MLESVIEVMKQKWKKLCWAGGTAAASYGLLAYVVPELLSVRVVSLGGAGVVGYLVYTKVAQWEIDKLLAGAKVEVEKLKAQVEGMIKKV